MGGIEYIADTLKFVAFIVGFIFYGFTWRRFRVSKEVKDRNLLLYFLFFALFALSSFVSRFLPSLRLSLVGFTFFLSLIGTLALALFCLEIFYLGDYRRSRKVKALLSLYMGAGTIFAIMLTVIVYIYHDYQETGASIPPGLLILLPTLALTLNSIYFALALKIWQAKRTVLESPLTECSEDEWAVYCRQSRSAIGACLAIGIAFIFLNGDILSATRTIWALMGWVLEILALILLYWGSLPISKGEGS